MSTTETNTHEGGLLQIGLVWAGLMVLLATTLALSYMPWGGAIVVAMVISTAKTMLIMRYYMHLKYRSHLVWLFSVAGMMWLILLFGLVLSDYLTRHWILVQPP